MFKMRTNLYITLILSFGAPAYFQEKFNIAESINRFSVELLTSVNHEGGESLNVALSPLTIWTMLSVVNEGAYDTTADQLDRALGQPQNKESVRNAYTRLSSLLKRKFQDVDFETSTGIYARSDFSVKKKFENIVQKYYGAKIKSVNFKDVAQSADVINRDVAAATKNRIPRLVIPADLDDAYLFITSTMYFRGQWQTPFNKSATQKDSFFDDKKSEIGKVSMMYQAHPFPYSRINKLNANAVELPYGFDDAFSMLILVPRGAQTLTNMLNSLNQISVTSILETIRKNNQMFSEDDVHLYLPKFKITSDFNLDPALERMGITDLFNSQKANLLGMFPHYLFLSRVIQKAEIEVDEDGTVAAAAGGSIFINRSPPPVVKANRPFAYFIIHRQSGSIIFAGKLSNPNTLG